MDPSVENMPRDRAFTQFKNPLRQATVAAVVMIGMLLLGWLAQLGGAELSSTWAYQAVGTVLMIFGVGNAITSLGSDKILQYWQFSFASYAGLTLLAVFSARLVSGVWIREAGSYFWIFMVLTFGYLTLLSILSIMRKIMHFAENEEWSEPR